MRRRSLVALFALLFLHSRTIGQNHDSIDTKALESVPEIQLVSDKEILADQDQKELLKKRLPARGSSRAAFVFEHNQQRHEALLAAAQREGLPVKIPGAASPVREAIVMQALSRELRAAGFVSFEASERSPEEAAAAFQVWCADNHIEKFAGVPATLVQMMQVEEEPIRLALIGQLDKIGSAKASGLLAKRALFDSSAKVREAATKALVKRPAKEYAAVLLSGFHHPWPAVGDRAADALTKLKPSDSVPALLELLDKPDPRAPFRDLKTKKLIVSEMVRLNHLRNCLLCHAASTGEGDGLLVASVPQPSRPVQKGQNKGQRKIMNKEAKPASSTARPYYGPPVKDAIRADLTFLRQDSSAMLKGKDGNPERFDFFLRTRPAKPEDWIGLPSNEMDYPQRRAALRTLRAITGKDAGQSSARWLEMVGSTKKRSEE